MRFHTTEVPLRRRPSYFLRRFCEVPATGGAVRVFPDRRVIHKQTGSTRYVRPFRNDLNGVDNGKGSGQTRDEILKPPDNTWHYKLEKDDKIIDVIADPKEKAQYKRISRNPASISAESRLKWAQYYQIKAAMELKKALEFTPEAANVVDAKIWLDVRNKELKVALAEVDSISRPLPNNWARW
jgi:hypothetical protein